MGSGALGATNFVRAFLPAAGITVFKAFWSSAIRSGLLAPTTATAGLASENCSADFDADFVTICKSFDFLNLCNNFGDAFDIRSERLQQEYLSYMGHQQQYPYYALQQALLVAMHVRGLIMNSDQLIRIYLVSLLLNQA